MAKPRASGIAGCGAGFSVSGEVCRSSFQFWPTSKRTNRVMVTPASSSSALTDFLLSDTDG